MKSLSLQPSSYRHSIYDTATQQNWIGKYGEMETGQVILNGHDKPDKGPACPFPEIQIILDALLQSFNPPAKPVPITTTITDKDYRKVFRKRTESTLTSASGKHLGYYKALLSLGLEHG